MGRVGGGRMTCGTRGVITRSYIRESRHLEDSQRPLPSLLKEEAALVIQAERTLICEKRFLDCGVVCKLYRELQGCSFCVSSEVLGWAFPQSSCFGVIHVPECSPFIHTPVSNPSKQNHWFIKLDFGARLSLSLSWVPSLG